VSGSTTSTPKKKPKFDDWSSLFLEDLRQYGNIKHAAEQAGIDRSTAYKARHRNKRFSTAWDEAMEDATDLLEGEARRRGYEGTDHPIIYQGEITDTYKEYSDTLLIFLLKAHRPEKFRDRYDITSGGERLVPIAILNVDPEAL